MNYILSSLYLRRLVNTPNIFNIIKAMSDASNSVKSLSLKTCIGEVHLVKYNDHYVISTFKQVAEMIESNNTKSLEKHKNCPVIILRDSCLDYSTIKSSLL